MKIEKSKRPSSRVDTIAIILKNLLSESEAEAVGLLQHREFADVRKMGHTKYCWTKHIIWLPEKDGI